MVDRPGIDDVTAGRDASDDEGLLGGFSRDWPQLADWRPALLPGLRVRRQVVRGQVWQVLGPPPGVPGGLCRLNLAAWRAAARLDGRRSVAQVWAGLQAREDAPTQAEWLQTLRTLQAQGLLLDPAGGGPAWQSPQAAPMPWPADGAGRSARRPRFHPLAWRLPLFDPTPLLDRLLPAVQPLFGRWAWRLWWLTVLVAGVLAVAHAGELIQHARQWLLTPRYLLLAALLAPPAKALHELAHGLALRRHGAAVPEAGVSFMLLVPLPYVDASAAAGLPRRRDRVGVSAAGIVVELALGALGLLGFLLLDGGGWRDAAFVLFFVCGVSGLAFNVNPLQRFDGYHLMTDLLQLPNLATRSSRAWAQAGRDWLLTGTAGASRRAGPAAGLQTDGSGRDTAPAWQPAPGERPWLRLYAPLAWAWQVALLAWVTAWLGGYWAPLGGAVGAWLLLRLLQPAASLLREGWRAACLAGRPAPVLGRLALLAVLPLAVLVLPLPDRSVVPAVVWPPDEAALRAGEDGFVLAVHARHGQPVQAGQTVLELHNPRLQAERTRAAARLERAEAEQFQSLAERSAAPDTAPGERAGQASQDVERLRAELARLDEQLARLRVRAAVAGRLVLPQEADLPGSYLARGTLVGQVLANRAVVVRAVLAQDEADRLGPEWAGGPGTDRGAGVRAASVLRADQPTRVWAAQWRRDPGATLPTATRELPSPALSERHGGSVQTDPGDDAARRTLEPVLLLDVQLLDAPLQDGQGLDADGRPGGADAGRLGARAWVRLDHGWAPLGWQAWRRATATLGRQTP